MFHCSCLKHCPTSSIRKCVIRLSPPIQLDNGLEYEVAVVLNTEILHNKLYYLVDWFSYDRTWEPTENLAKSSDLDKEFHHQYPNKPGPIATMMTPTNRRFRVGNSMMATM